VLSIAVVLAFVNMFAPLVHHLNALSLDLFGFGVYSFPLGAAGALSFHDPFEGTEIKVEK
jgi:hypothetical protein